MLFSNSGGHYGAVGLGVVPAGGAGGTPLIQSQGTAPQATAPEVAGQEPEGVCTSDKRLIYAGGAWRVQSLNTSNTSDCKSVIASEDANYVAKQKEPVYVGVFPIDPNNTDGQITDIESPAFIGHNWGEWFHQAYLTIVKAKIARGVDNAFHYSTPILSLLPRVVGATEDFYDNGTPQGAPLSQHPMVASCLAKYPGDQTAYAQWLVAAQQAFAANKPAPPAPTLASAGDPACSATIAMSAPFMPIPAVLASGGHALHPSQAWFSTDASGNRVTNVVYDGDPNTYSYYSYAQWLAALSPAMLTDGSGWAIDKGDYLKPSNTTEFNRNQNVPPVGRFTYPFDVGTKPAGFYDAGGWGLWLSLAPAGGRSSSSSPAEGDWDTGLDAPSHAIMQIAMAPLPQEGLWDNILDVIEWIPTTIGDALFDLAGWLSGAICGMSPQQLAQMTAKVPPGYAQAVALGALEVRLNAQCGQTVDCKATPNAPTCLKTQPAVTPWWQRWYVIIPALALVGFALFTAFGDNKTTK